MASLGRDFLALNNNKIHFQTPQYSLPLSNLLAKRGSIWFDHHQAHQRVIIPKTPMKPVSKKFAVISAIMNEKPKKLGHNSNCNEAKGFVEEMRSMAMRLHTKEQAPKEGQKEVEAPEQRHVAKWDPSVEGYLSFLVDSKLVYDTLEGIINEVAFPYTELRNTGLERSERLAKDLEWFKEQGHAIPEPTTLGDTYSQYLKELSEKNHKAILCHFYNLYFGHTAGGRIMGKKVAEKILNNKELEFYKWNGNVSQLLENATNKLNKMTESWTREEKKHCLEETDKAFKYYGNIIGLILS